MRQTKLVCLLVLILGTTSTTLTQGPAQVGGAAQLTHVGIVVEDIDETVRQYVRVMGFPTPRIVPAALDLPNGEKTEVRLTNMYQPNFHIELVQPVSQTGPYYEHLQKYGMSIQHIGLTVSGDVKEIRTGLEAKGGRWTLGPENGYAYVNFQSTLGTTFEVITPAISPPAGTDIPVTAEGAVVPPLASLMVTHVGFGVTNAAQVARDYADTLGFDPPAVSDYTDSQYPPDSNWNEAAPLRVASWRQGDIGIELIESVGGPTPWSDYVEMQHGTAAQHIAIPVGNMMDEMVRDLQMKGGTWTNGKSGGTYAYLDFMDTLGIIFEINGTSKMAAEN